MKKVLINSGVNVNLTIAKFCLIILSPSVHTIDYMLMFFLPTTSTYISRCPFFKSSCNLLDAKAMIVTIVPVTIIVNAKTDVSKEFIIGTHILKILKYYKRKLKCTFS